MIIKPKIDTREYKYLTLKNDLEVLLISDPSTDVSAASMTVNVGYYDDPDDVPGLAHFLEHMLFMGTFKYPEENYFQHFVTDSGGETNAMTMEESTTYFFEVLNEFFDQAIDIYSHFFIDPILSDNVIEREMNAVDSEHKKNYNFDIARVINIIKEQVTNNHPFKKFGTGNLKTLKKDNIRNILIKFYQKHYSSNLMKLVILSNKSINEIITLVTNKFSKIPNNEYKKNSINCLPFDINSKNSLCAKLFNIIPVYDSNILILNWQLPYINEYKYKPLEYISTLLGHEGDGSIYYLLKTHGLCTYLRASIMEQDSSYYLFSVFLELTDSGIKYIPSIIDLIFSYLEMIKKNGIVKWYYNELKTINQINFDYSPIGSKIDYVSSLSLNMLKYKPQDVIYGDYNMGQFNDKFLNITNRCLDCMEKNNTFISILSKKFEQYVNLKEKWYRTKYTVYDNPTDYMYHFEKYNFDTTPSFPLKNIFIPQSLHLSNFKNYNDPTKIRTDNIEFWAKKDTVFKIPKIFISYIIHTDKIHKNVINYLIFNIFVSILEYKLETQLFYAKMCSSGVEMDIGEDSMIIIFVGFKDKIEKLVEIVINNMLNISITEDEFIFSKENLKKNLANSIYSPAYILSNEFLRDKIYMMNYSNEYLLQNIDYITFQQMEKPKKWLKSNCSFKSFIYGDIDQDIVTKITKKLLLLSNKQYTKNIPKNQIIPLDKGEQQIYIKKLSPEMDKNNVIIVFYEIKNVVRGMTKMWEDIVISLLIIETFIKEHFYAQLRSKEQTGYIVKSYIQMFKNIKGNIMGLSFIIQSPKYNPTDLKKRINKFVKSMFGELKNINQGEVTHFKTIIRKLLEKKFTTQSEEFVFYNNEISIGEYAFDYRKKLLDRIQFIDQDVLIKFYEKYFINKKTRKLRIMEVYKKN